MSGHCWILEGITEVTKQRKRTQSFVLKAGENKVGKYKNSDIKIPSYLCSRNHCSIFVSDNKVSVKDNVS